MHISLACMNDDDEIAYTVFYHALKNQKASLVYGIH